MPLLLQHECAYIVISLSRQTWRSHPMVAALLHLFKCTCNMLPSAESAGGDDKHCAVHVCLLQFTLLALASNVYCNACGAKQQERLCKQSATADGTCCDWCGAPTAAWLAPERRCVQESCANAFRGRGQEP